MAMQITKGERIIMHSHIVVTVSGFWRLQYCDTVVTIQDAYGGIIILV